METEEVFGHEATLSDYNGEFPFHVVFYDIQDEKVKEMKVTEQAWNQALKTFEDNDKISEPVIFKYMSKHDTVKPKPYFKEE